MQVRREAILSKALSHNQQPTLDAWAAVAPDRVARFEQAIADPEVLVLVAEANSEILASRRSFPQGENCAPSTSNRIQSDLLAMLCCLS